MTQNSAEYPWPWQHDFPPFYTIQTNSDTKAKQLEAWRTLILEYCKTQNIHQLEVSESSTTALFNNEKINRRLSPEDIVTVLDFLATRGNVEWADSKNKSSCKIMWRSPEEWGKTISSWIQQNGMTNTVCTFYELINGDESQGQEFHGLEDWLLVRALRTLEQQGKAELIGEEGVKFF